MAKIALHPATAQAVENFLNTPTHALCLIGPPGAGKSFLANYLAESLLGKTVDDSLYTIPEGSGIEQVRALQQFLRLKKPGSAAIRRVVIIEQAQTLGDEAQNALLKTLEEPPTDTVFILTADGSANLRPTIYSRVQKLNILPLSAEQAQAYFQAQDAAFSKAFHLSGGYAGLLHALLHDTEHELVAAVEQAKILMQANPYERLLLVDGLAKQKESLPNLFYALQRVIGALLPRTTDPAKLKRLTAAMRAVYEAELDTSKSANTKLLLADLFLVL